MEDDQLLPEIYGDRLQVGDNPASHADLPVPSQVALALWANEVQRACLLEAGDDVDAALAAAELIVSTQPIPDEVNLHPTPPVQTRPISAYLAHDIRNRRAQGVLNRSLEAARGLTAAARQDLEAALRAGPEDSGTAILEFLDRYRLQLVRLLTNSQLAAVLEGAREVAGRVPAIEEDVAKLGKSPPPSFPVEDTVHLPTIEEAARSLAERNVLTRAGYDELDAAARAKAFTVAGVDSQEALGKIRDVMSDNISRGADYESFRKQVLEAVDEGTFLSPAHQETVFRTNVQTAFSDGQMTVLQNPLIRSGFPYAAYDSIHDDRARHDHNALDKAGIQGTNIYRADDPVFQMFRPPWDYNCRCSWTPLTVRQAAERGVEEARRWLESGVEPADPAHVPMPPFAPPEGFQRAASSAPLSIRLSLQPMATFSTSQSAALSIGISDDSYPRDNAGRFLDKLRIADAAHDPVLHNKLRESIPEDQRPKLDRMVSILQSGGTIHHPREPAGMAVGIDGVVADPEWAEYGLQRAAREGWEERDAERTGRRKAADAFARKFRDVEAVTKIHRTLAGIHEDDLGTGDIRERLSEVIDRYGAYLDDASPHLQEFATEADLRAVARLWHQIESGLARTAEGYISARKGEGRAGITGERIVERHDELVRALRDTELIALYESIVEAAHMRADQEAEDDPEPEVPAEPATTPSPAFAVKDEEGGDERVRLIAEILVAMFGDEAVEVAGKLDMSEGPALGIAFAVIGQRRYQSTSPGRGWVRGPQGKRGGTIWIYQGTGAGAAPAPAPAPQVAQPAPTPQTSQPQSAPAGQQRNLISTTNAKAAIKDAFNILGPGGNLTDAEKRTLAAHLPNIGRDDLKQLHSLLGAGGVYGTKAQIVAKVQQTLMRGVAAPTPTPTPAPTPQAQPASPLKFVRPPVGASGKPSTVPMKDEISWETGKAQTGQSLNGVDFAPAPPKFWEKVADVDVKEPPPLRKVDRVGVLIQEPDGRIWIVKPTNGYGNRTHTMPGGGVEKGLTDQQNALKEVWEETGLQVEITGYAGDFKDSNNGNNGRLYIGKRVGGAPWDAKVESFIINQKTGQPAAESDEVMLVTPDRAAKLLHRTDDLAQLYLTTKMPVDLPTNGAGSQPIKNILEAIAPATEAYKKECKAKGISPGNAELHTIQELRGFSKKPKVVSQKDFDALMKQGGHIEMLRGMSGFTNSTTGQIVKGTDLAEQYRSGDHFAGHGVFGSGTYCDAQRGPGNVVASGNYGGYQGGLLRMALPKSAKIIKASELEKAAPTSPKAWEGYRYKGGKETYECWLGVQAALAGYDAIEVDGKGRQGTYGSPLRTHHPNRFHVILNRSIMVVQDKDPPSGYQIP